MGLASPAIVFLHPGESTSSAGYNWTVDGVRDEAGPNYAARVATIRVSRGRACKTVGSWPVSARLKLC